MRLGDEGEGEDVVDGTAPFPAELLRDQSLIYRLLGEYLPRCYPDIIPEPSGSGVPPVERRILGKNRFWSRAAPSISFTEYLGRVESAMPKLETTVLLAIPIYAERLRRRWEESVAAGEDPPSGLLLGPNLLHRFLITAVCLGSKALGDHFYANPFCGAVGGVAAGELYGMELELAARLGWDLQCSLAEYRWSWQQLVHNTIDNNNI